jgi:TPR repeat protein
MHYAADKGEVSALNALAIMYLYGEYNSVSGEWIVKQNVTYAC